VNILSYFSFGDGGWGVAFLAAAALTVTVSLAGLLIGAAIGALMCWARVSRSPTAYAIAQAYLAVFRGVPELLIIYFVYFGSSTLLTFVGNAMGIQGFVGVPPFLAGALAVGVISGAYQAEVYRSALSSITRGEIEAAVSVGMRRFLRFRRIIAPQVFRFALPALGNLWQAALKDAALISVTGLTELVRTSQVASASTHLPFVFFGAAAVIYLIITSVTDYGVEKLEARVSRGMKRRQAS
jgi:octopine/nopaline transport system permease protein